MRRYPMMALLGLLAVVAGSEPAAAADSWRGSYCIGYREGGVDCSFTSYAQCQASMSGIDSACFARPGVAAPTPGVAQSRSRKAKRNAAGN